MSDDPKYSGVGAHGTMPSIYGGKSRDQLMAEFKAEMAAKRNIRVVDYTGPVPKHKVKPENYPWKRPGWKW